MDFSPAQCRAARALLNWSQSELGRRARVDTKTVADYERGATSPHFRTLEALARAFVAEGVVFIEPTDLIVAGVGLRAGSEAAKRMGGDSASASKDNGMKAAAWDEELPVPAEIEQLRAYWRDRPREWAALSEIGRQTLSEKMYGAPDVADAAFGQGFSA
jgi:transcriptional regulator with XRE-family HTH domain